MGFEEDDKCLWMWKLRLLEQIKAVSRESSLLKLWEAIDRKGFDWPSWTELNFLILVLKWASLR